MSLCSKVIQKAPECKQVSVPLIEHAFESIGSCLNFVHPRSVSKSLVESKREGAWKRDIWEHASVLRSFQQNLCTSCSASSLLRSLVLSLPGWGGVFGQHFMRYEYVPLYKCKDAVFITWVTESIKTLVKMCAFLCCTQLCAVQWQIYFNALTTGQELIYFQACTVGFWGVK